MKNLLISILIILSLYNYGIKEKHQKIPVVTILSQTEKNTIDYSEKDLSRVIYNDVAEFYKEMSKGQITFYNPFKRFFIKTDLEETYTYNHRKTYGLKSIKKSHETIDYNIFDVNNNQIIEKDELIIIQIIETKDTYEKPVAATIKTKDFYLGNLKVESFIQLGVEEVFSNRKSLLTPSTLAHEIGHHFGLPDLYDTDYSSKGLGPMSLMSEIHSDQPIHFDPWSKLTLGIEQAIPIQSPGRHAIEKGKIYLVETNEYWIYYLIEGRSFEGYDETLSEVMSSDGIFIYKINERVINQSIDQNHVNRDENNMGVKFLGNEVNDLEHGVYLKGIDSSHLRVKIRKNNWQRLK